MRPRVLLLLTNYPTLSQTYKESEIRALLNDYDVGIVSIGKSAAPYQRHIGFLQAESWGSIERYVDEFQPNWIHGHYLHTSGHLHKVSRYAKTRFTVRTHSFDILGKTQEELKTQVDHVNSEECAGILVFPFLADRLTAIGVHHSKIQIDWPVVDYERFLDTGPQTDSLIINTGACIPKKNMESFLSIGADMPQRKFLLYPIGYLTKRIAEHNASLGHPVAIKPTVEPDNMPRVYKSCEWLVYTANPKIPTVGWPMAIAEAQASGCGVLIQDVRNDMREYVGPAGYVFKDTNEAKEILSTPYPTEMRNLGFIHARKSSIRDNIKRLTSLWKA